VQGRRGSEPFQAPAVQVVLASGQFGAGAIGAAGGAQLVEGGADDGLVIAGTLTLLEGEGPHPAVVLLCPGRLDREAGSRRAQGRPQPRPDLAARLPPAVPPPGGP
jgi:hypothetical protein